MNVENDIDVLKLLAEIVVKIMKVEANVANIKALLSDIYNGYQSQPSQNLLNEFPIFTNHKQALKGQKKMNRVEIILEILKKLFNE